MPQGLATALQDRYRLDRELGQGGMATVYLAEDLKHHRKVAVKVLRPELAATLGPERFSREVEVAARLQHPHILGLLDSGDADGFFYYVMPYVEGETLRERLARVGELPVPEAIHLLGEVAEALAVAHRAGVIHRDIKPENIMLSGKHAVVMDFGVAKAVSEASGRQQLTTAGVALGTPAYMAPEQATADPQLDGRADIYALGVVGYEMLTGHPPFHGLNPQQTLAAHVTQAPAPVGERRPGLAPAVESVIMRCLAKRPADRFQAADELVAALEPLATPSGGMTPTHTQPIVAARTRLTTVPLWAILLVVALIVAGGVWYRRASAGTSEREAAAMERSVGVLPFANLSQDPANEYFSDGMTDELITALARVQGLRVPARTSAFAFKGKTVDLRAVGEQLKVTTVLEGSVRREGDRLRVTAQLVKVSDGFQVWTERYDRQVKDVFAVQDEIARAIVSALKIRLTAGDSGTLARAPTSDLGALDLYLQGRFYWAKRGKANFERAAQLFEAAIAKDPRFARAYAGLADVYVLMPEYADVADTDYYARADSAARRAIALDSSLAEPYAAIGYMQVALAQSREAEQSLLKALKKNPAYATAHLWRGILYRQLRKYAVSDSELAAARQLDPLSLIVWTNQGINALAQGRVDSAIAAFQSVLANDSQFVQARRSLSRAYLGQGRVADAIPHLKWMAVNVGAGDDLGYLAYAYGRLGQRALGEEILQRLIDRHREHGDKPGFVLAYIGLGPPDSVFAWLERWRADGDLPAGELDDRTYDPLRSDPRFVKLVHLLAGK